MGRHTYSLEEFPAVPVVEAEVINPVTGESASGLRGKIDTGAAISIIPQVLVSQLGLNATRTVLTTSYDGRSFMRSTYIVRLSLNGGTSFLIEVCAMPRPNVLIGRDALRHFIVSLDGINEVVELVQP